MDDIELFATLRPTVQVCTHAERSALRADVFGELETPRSTHDAPISHDGNAIDSMGGSNRSLTSGLVAAAAVVVLGVGGLWAIQARRDVPSPSQAPPTITNPMANQIESTVPSLVDPPTVPSTASKYSVPLIAIDQPGWTLTGASASQFDPGGQVVFASADGFEGPWVHFELLPDEVDYSYGEEQSIAIGPLTGAISSVEDQNLIEWTDAAGNRLAVSGERVPVDQMVQMAASTTVDGIHVRVEVPTGFHVATTEDLQALGHSAEYQWTHDDGRSVDVRFSYGGQGGLYRHTGGEARSTLPVADETFSLLDYGQGGRYRAYVVRGPWVWEFDAGSFGSVDDFGAFLLTVGVVDEATWAASLPPNVIGSDDRAVVIADLLVGVPLPPDFDVDPLVATGSTLDRYQLIAEVSGAIGCGWLDQWFIGQEASDETMQSEAARALATSHDWAMLSEINDQGGWSEVFWQFADAVNGGEGVMTGSGPQIATRVEAEGALGCQFG